MTGAFQFIPPDAARRYLQAYERYAPDDMVGMLMQAGREEWHATIRMVRGGFVDTNAFAKIEKDDFLRALRKTIDAQNKERVARDLPPREGVDWLIPPKHDRDARAIVWSVLTSNKSALRDRDQVSSAFVALFGREVQIVVEIVAPATIIHNNPQDVSSIVELMRFVEGKRYQDFLPGKDVVSADGLLPLLGVAAIERRSWTDDLGDGDTIVALALGGALAVGGGALGIVLFVGGRRDKAARNRRRR